MTSKEEWQEFLSSLISNGVAEYKKSEEYTLQKQRRKEIDKFLSTNLTADQNVWMEEILFELGTFAERETEVGYYQGMHDCVWILKNLGVLA